MLVLLPISSAYALRCLATSAMLVSRPRSRPLCPVFLAALRKWICPAHRCGDVRGVLRQRPYMPTFTQSGRATFLFPGPGPDGARAVSAQESAGRAGINWAQCCDFLQVGVLTAAAYLYCFYLPSHWRASAQEMERLQWKVGLARDVFLLRCVCDFG